MKQLDIEYKNQISQELPDLWSRIEAGVDAYEASKINNASKEDAPDKCVAADVVQSQTASASNESNVINISAVRKRRFAIAGRIVAAAACLFVVVGVVRMFGGRKNYTTDAGASYEASDAPSAAYEDYSDDAAACEEAVYETEPVIEAEPAYEETDSMTEMCQEAAADYEDESIFETEDASGTKDNGAAGFNYLRGETVKIGAAPSETFAENVVTKINGVDISDSGYQVSLLYQVATEKFGLLDENAKSENKLRAVVTEDEKELAKKELSFEDEETEAVFGKLKTISVSPVVSIDVDDLFAKYPNILGEEMSEEFGTYVVTTEDGLMYQIYTFNEEKMQVVMILGVSKE